MGPTLPATIALFFATSFAIFAPSRFAL